MKAEIESIVCNWADEIPHIFIRVINAITLSANEEELRTAVKRIAEETELDKFFAYGYGAHHFWLTHRSDEEINWAFSTPPDVRTGRITVQEKQTE